MPDSDDLHAVPRGPAPVLGLGERLRSARKAKALSVQQVADALRLGEASVLALEEGRFEAMGAPVFVRGHLKRYAQLVGLSPEAVLDAYRAASPHSDAPPTLARPREQADTVRVGPWAWWLAGTAIVIGIIIAMTGGEDTPQAPLPAAPIQQQQTPAPPMPQQTAPGVMSPEPATPATTGAGTEPVLQTAPPLAPPAAPASPESDVTPPGT